MAFIETSLPTTIAYGASGGAEFSTDVIIAQGGAEQRNQNWSQSRGRWQIGYVHRNATETAALIAFFRAVAKGRLHGFRFRDPADDTGTNEPLGSGNGVLVAYQLIKRYTSGGQTFDRTITKPIAGTVTARLNGTPTVDFTVNTATGVITFNSPPANGVAIDASFTFEVPVRFNTDRIEIQRVANAVYSWPSIELLEIRDIS